MPLFEEEILEPLARYFRFINGVDHINTAEPIIIADLGCGPEIRFYKYLRSNGVKLKKYYGVDPLIKKNVVSKFKKKKNINFVTKPLVKKVALKSNSVDYVVGFAFFEHIDHPKEILAEAYRILKPGGKVILTVPSDMAQPFLEFMSHKLKIISRREIEEHKQYFNKESLMKIIPKGVKKKNVKHRYFEFGLNNLLVIKK